MTPVPVKPKKHSEYNEAVYSTAQWTLLENLREKAAHIMTTLETFNLKTLVYGSIARGDVNNNSDVDVFVAEPQS